MSDQPETPNGSDLTAAHPANALDDRGPLLGHVQREPVIWCGGTRRSSRSARPVAHSPKGRSWTTPSAAGLCPVMRVFSFDQPPRVS